MTALEDFKAVNASFPYTDPIKGWKEQGKEAMGWLCIYVPEEIIHAAGILPVRLAADGEQISLDQANIYVAETTCSFIRSCLQLGLTDQFKFLDAIAACTACQGCNRLSEVWSYYIKDIPVLYTLDLPRNHFWNACRL